MERKDFVTPPEAAEMLMCSTLHIRTLLEKRRLPFYKVGNRTYIPRAAVEAYIEANTIPALVSD